MGQSNDALLRFIFLSIIFLSDAFLRQSWVAGEARAKVDAVVLWEPDARAWRLMRVSCGNRTLARGG